jgi:single-strand DNA-binding protein
MRDANGTDLCAFSVAADVGFGERKQTYWVDVSKWGKGAEGLSRILRKGTAVAVIGELTTREHDGKTYLQCRADDVTILGGGERGEQQSNNQQRGGSYAEDLGDEVPF